jgi:hypothetical protein
MADLDKLVSAIRNLGSSKGDVLEALMVDGLRAHGVPEDRARNAAGKCSNAIWTNGMVSGAVTVVLVSAAHANVAGAIAGGSAAAGGAVLTYLFSDACADVRRPTTKEVNDALDEIRLE